VGTTADAGGVVFTADVADAGGVVSTADVADDVGVVSTADVAEDAGVVSTADVADAGGVVSTADVAEDVGVVSTADVAEDVGRGVDSTAEDVVVASTDVVVLCSVTGSSVVEQVVDTVEEVNTVEAEVTADSSTEDE